MRHRNQSMTKTRLLLIGPVPPPFGGATISFASLLAQIDCRDTIDSTVLDSQFSGSPRAKLQTLIGTIGRVLRNISSTDVVSLHASTYGFILQSIIIKPFCRIAGKPLMGRIFGGSIKEVYQQSRRPMRWIIRHALSLDLLLLQSRDLTSYFQNLLPNTRVDWFPTSRSLQADPPHKFLRSPPRLLFAGYIREEKGVAVALDALTMIATPVSCDFYGRRKDDQLITQIEESSGCVYRGEISPEELLLRMQDYDVLLMPTFYEGEGYPGVILEAFSLGLPVIASNWKFIPEIVEDGVNGFLVEPRNPAALAAAIDRIASDPAAYEVMSRNAFATAQEFDTKKWNGDRFEELVNELARR